MSKEPWTEELFGEESPRALDEHEAGEPVSLETGFQNLEIIVKTLEQKDLPLEKALSLFKEGVGLVQYCSGLLNEAERQMEILLEGPNGQLQTKPASIKVEG